MRTLAFMLWVTGTSMGKTRTRKQIPMEAARTFDGPILRAGRKPSGLIITASGPGVPGPGRACLARASSAAPVRLFHRRVRVCRHLLGDQPAGGPADARAL